MPRCSWRDRVGQDNKFCGVLLSSWYGLLLVGYDRLPDIHLWSESAGRYCTFGNQCQILADNLRSSSPLALRSTVSLLLVPKVVHVTPCYIFIPRCTTNFAREQSVFSQLERAKQLSSCTVCETRDNCTFESGGASSSLVMWTRCRISCIVVSFLARLHRFRFSLENFLPQIAGEGLHEMFDSSSSWDFWGTRSSRGCNWYLRDWLVACFLCLSISLERDFLIVYFVSWRDNFWTLFHDAHLAIRSNYRMVPRSGWIAENHIQPRIRFLQLLLNEA